MKRIAAKSPQAKRAYALVVSLQQRFVERMQDVSRSAGSGRTFEPAEWFRAEGEHGGGTRYVANDSAVFNQASVNVSQVQYDADESKALASATALSSIIHPHNPLAPSVHLHVSWTEMKSGHGYWRVMADLNPAIENPQHTARFKAVMETAAEDKDAASSRCLNAENECLSDKQYLDTKQLTGAFSQGDRYFYIPALERHRGVCHFYLENYYTDDAEADLALAEHIISRVINSYANLLSDVVSGNALPSEADFRRQLDYHSLYFFQVLTLDRGTTSGLLVHDQNDVGILGSLPMHVDKALIRSWQANMPAPQQQLLQSLLACLPSPESSSDAKSLIDESVKKALANAVRAHYKQHPEALALQASGEIIPPTVANHQ